MLCPNKTTGTAGNSFFAAAEPGETVLLGLSEAQLDDWFSNIFMLRDLEEEARQTVEWLKAART